MPPHTECRPVAASNKTKRNSLIELFEMEGKKKEVGLFEKLVQVEWFEHLGCCYDPAYKCIEEHLDWGVERMSTLTFAGFKELCASLRPLRLSGGKSE